MKRMLEHLINVVQKKDVELMFGVGSRVEIQNVSYSTNIKRYVIHSKVFATNIDESIDVFPIGLNILISEGWKYTGIIGEITMINSIDVL